MRKMRCLCMALVLALVCVTGSAAPEPIGLPPLAKVLDKDPGTDRWQATGLLSGGLPLARREFGLCLDRQGWSKSSKTVTGRPGKNLSVTVWTRGRRRLLLMLWEKGPGTTGFSLGEESRDKQKRKDK